MKKLLKIFRPDFYELDGFIYQIERKPSRLVAFIKRLKGGK